MLLGNPKVILRALGNPWVPCPVPREWNLKVEKPRDSSFSPEFRGHSLGSVKLKQLFEIFCKTIPKVYIE